MDPPTTTAADPPLHSATALDIVISFDVTGSMMPVLASVRQNLERLSATIFAGASRRDVRMQVFAHGDYDSRPYQIMSTDGFTRDPEAVAAFIRSVGAVENCWNEGEAYELVLDRCKTLQYRPEAKKLLILVGDDLPHPPHFPMNTGRVDWRACAQHLAEMDICIYAVQCASLDVARARGFYRELTSYHRHSKYILLDQFYMMAELVLGIFHAASDDMDALRGHEADMARAGNRTRNMARAFATLRGEDIADAENAEEAENADPEQSAALGPDLASLRPVAPGRFQTMPVTTDCSIRDFVRGMGIVFRAGRGFYELSKPEEVSHKKEVILEDKGSGDMFTGPEVLRYLRVPPGGKVQVSSRPTDRYRFFVQSTSYNRRLKANTRFLYELDRL
jgi:hypothetical protein